MNKLKNIREETRTEQSATLLDVAGRLLQSITTHKWLVYQFMARKFSSSLPTLLPQGRREYLVNWQSTTAEDDDKRRIHTRPLFVSTRPVLVPSRWRRRGALKELNSVVGAPAVCVSPLL